MIASRRAVLVSTIAILTAMLVPIGAGQGPTVHAAVLEAANAAETSTVSASTQPIASRVEVKPSKEQLMALAVGEDVEKQVRALSTLARHYEREITQADVDRLAPLLEHRRVEVRLEVARALAYGHNLGEKHLVEAVKTLPIEQSLCAATGFLYGRPNRDRKREAALVIPVFEKGLFDKNVDASVRKAVADRMENERRYFLEPVYLKMLDADLPWIRRQGVLLSPFNNETYKKLRVLVRDENRDVRWAVAFKLYHKVKFPEVRKHALPILRTVLANNNETTGIREMAIIGLGNGKDKQALPQLIALLRAKNEPKEETGVSGLQRLAGEAVVKITGEDFDFTPVRYECREFGNGIHALVQVDDENEVRRRLLRERKRLLEWWDAEGRGQHALGAKKYGFRKTDAP